MNWKHVAIGIAAALVIVPFEVWYLVYAPCSAIYSMTYRLGDVPTRCIIERPLN